MMFLMRVPILVSLFVIALAMVSVMADENGGSKCEGTKCASGPPDQKCEAKYELGDKCCPVWYCTDKSGGVTTHYGISSALGGSMAQSVSSSTGGEGAADFFAGIQNMFANMFGR